MNDDYIITLSDSDEEILKKVTKNFDVHSKQKNKSTICQKRKHSANLMKSNDSKKCKILCSKANSLNNKNIIIDKTSNVDHKNDNSSDNCSFSQLNKPEELSQIKNTSPTKINNISEQVNQLQSQPSTSQKLEPIRKVIRPTLVIKDKIPIPVQGDDVFSRFIKTCIEIKNDDITKEILHKLQKRYDKIEPSQTNAEEFKLFLNGIISNILKREQKKFYSFIQEVNYELKKFNCKSKIVESVNNLSVETREFKKNNDNSTIEEENDLSKDDLSKIKKLDAAIKKCQEKIQELEAQEINFDEEEDSVYLKEDRYKRKYIELCAMRSKIIGDKVVKREIHNKPIKLKNITEKVTGITVLDESIISFINSNLKKLNKLKHIKNPSAIADFHTIPDYQDIRQCINKCNIEHDLQLREKNIKKIAHKTVVNYLKNQRIHESFNYLSSYLEIQEDPAKSNEELNKKLIENKREGDKKLNKMFKKYETKEYSSSTNEEEKNEESSDEELNKKLLENKREGDKKLNKMFEKYEKKECFSSINEEEENEESSKDDNIEQKDENNEKTDEKKHINTVDKVKKVQEIVDLENEDELVHEKKDKSINNLENVCDEVKPNEENQIGYSNTDNKIISQELNIEILNKSMVSNKKNCKKNIQKKQKNDVLNTLLRSYGLSEFLDSNKDTSPVVNDNEIEIINDNEFTVVNKMSTNIIEHTLEKNSTFMSDKENNNSKFEEIENKPSIVIVEKEESENLIKSLPILEIKKAVEKKEINNIIVDEKKIMEVNDSTDETDIIEEILVSPTSNDYTNVEEKTETSNEERFELNQKKSGDEESPYVLKVRSFAKPPDWWKNSLSPEKVKSESKIFTEETKVKAIPGFVDLTNDKETTDNCSSVQDSNPLLNTIVNSKTKNTVIVKNVINNYEIPECNTSIKVAKVVTLKNVCSNNPENERIITYHPNENLLKKKVSANNTNQISHSLSNDTNRNS